MRLILRRSRVTHFMQHLLVFPESAGTGITFRYPISYNCDSFSLTFRWKPHRLTVVTC